MKPDLTFRALVPVALAVFAVLSGTAGAQSAASAPTTAAPAPDYTPTRADVERDLAAWRESGLEAQWAGDETPDINSPVYISDYRKYQSTVHGSGMSQPASQSQTEPQRRW